MKSRVIERVHHAVRDGRDCSAVHRVAMCRVRRATTAVACDCACVWLWGCVKKAICTVLCCVHVALVRDSYSIYGVQTFGEYTSLTCMVSHRCRVFFSSSQRATRGRDPRTHEEAHPWWFEQISDFDLDDVRRFLPREQCKNQTGAARVHIAIGSRPLW